jgi:hypothetical protein
MGGLILPDFITTPHYEINEDGVKNHHPGYMVAYCIRCGNEFIKSRTSSITTCRDKNCGRGKV